MAYDYQKSKKIYQSLTKEQQQQYVDQNKNDANFQQFMKDYAADTNRNNAVSTPTSNSYQNQGAGNYSYNPQTQYYEKAPAYQNQGQWNYSYNPVSWYYENQNKPQTNQYTDYSKYNNNSDFYWQNNQYQWNADTINGTLWWMATDIYNQWQKGYSDLMGGGNYPQNFDDAVNNKLKSAFWLNSLDEVRERYPEYYDSLVQALDSVQWVRDATDPSQRQMLDGQLQGIIWSVIGAGSDTSKLKLLENTIMNKFQDGDRVKQDMQNIVKLQTEWKTISEIASQMWVSEDQVQQAILAYNWLDNKLWEYYQLKSWVASDITEPYDKQLARLDEEKKIALERANRQVDWLKQDFDTQLERQKQQNDINAHNADAIAGRTGLAFSKRGIEWLNYVAEQARQIIDDITKNYDRNNQNLADGIADIIRKWQRNNEDLMKASQDALTAAKNNFTANMLAVQQQYGTVGLQAQQALANNVQWFIEQAQNIYDNALVRQQQNLTNLINNVSNINALEAQNLTMRNAKIQQFQAESMNLNRNQLQWLAQQLWMDTGSYQDLVNYQVQAVANELNGYMPWAWMQFQWVIQWMLDSWYTPNEAMSMIMNSPERQAMTTESNPWSWSSAWWQVIFNTATGESKYIWIDGMWWWGSATGISGVPSTTDANWNYQRVNLWEQAIDTWIKNVYGSNVKLAPTVWAMLESAYDKLLDQWIELQIWDSYRSYETQKKAYEEDQAKPANQRKWVAAPWKSYHEIGQAIDVAQSQMNDPAVIQALLDAGFTRPVKSEPRHWSYGEWKDMFWWTPSNPALWEWWYDPSLTGYFENWFKLSKDDRANTLKEYWITQREFNTQYNAYFDEKEKTEALENITKLRDTAQKLLDWNKKNSSSWLWSLHEWWADLETYKEWSYSYKWLWWLIQWKGQTKASEWIAMYNFLKNNQSLDKFLEAKKNWWTFGSMSNAEWQLIWWAASLLNWETNDKNFEQQLQDMIDEYDKAIAKIWGTWGSGKLKWTIDLASHGRL